MPEFLGLSYNENRPKFIGRPVELYGQLANKADQEYAANKSAWDALDVASDNIEVPSYATDRKTAILNPIKEKMKSLAETGSFGDSSYYIQQAANTLAKNGEMNQLQLAVKQRQAQEESLDKAVVAKEMSADDARRAKEFSYNKSVLLDKQRRLTASTDNPYKFESQYSGFTPSKYIDPIMDIVTKLKGIYEPDATGGFRIVKGKENDPTVQSLSLKEKYQNFGEVARDVTTALNNHNEVQAGLRDRNTMDLGLKQYAPGDEDVAIANYEPQQQFENATRTSNGHIVSDVKVLKGDGSKAGKQLYDTWYNAMIKSGADPETARQNAIKKVEAESRVNKKINDAANVAGSMFGFNQQEESGSIKFDPLKEYIAKSKYDATDVLTKVATGNAFNVSLGGAAELKNSANELLTSRNGILDAIEKVKADVSILPTDKTKTLVELQGQFNELNANINKVNDKYKETYNSISNKDANFKQNLYGAITEDESGNLKYAFVKGMIDSGVKLTGQPQILLDKFNKNKGLSPNEYDALIDAVKGVAKYPAGNNLYNAGLKNVYQELSLSTTAPGNTRDITTYGLAAQNVLNKEDSYLKANSIMQVNPQYISVISGEKHPSTSSNIAGVKQRSEDPLEALTSSNEILANKSLDNYTMRTASGVKVPVSAYVNSLLRDGKIYRLDQTGDKMGGVIEANINDIDLKGTKFRVGTTVDPVSGKTVHSLTLKGKDGKQLYIKSDDPNNETKIPLDAIQVLSNGNDGNDLYNAASAKAVGIYQNMVSKSQTGAVDMDVLNTQLQNSIALAGAARGGKVVRDVYKDWRPGTNAKGSADFSDIITSSSAAGIANPNKVNYAIVNGNIRILNDSGVPINIGGKDSFTSPDDLKFAIGKYALEHGIQNAGLTNLIRTVNYK